MSNAGFTARSIAVIRHGETDWNAQLRIQGRTEVPLNDTGRLQARESAEMLAESGSWRHVITSPLGRAVETARIIADTLGLGAPVVNPAVLERDFGPAEGLTRDEAYARWPNLDVPGAERLEDLAQRGAEAFRQILEESPGAIVVAHGALMRSALGALSTAEVPRVLNGEAWTLEPLAGVRVSNPGGTAGSSMRLRRLGAPRLAVPR